MSEYEIVLLLLGVSIGSILGVAIWAFIRRWQAVRYQQMVEAAVALEKRRRR